MWDSATLLKPLVSTLIFGLLSILLMLLGFKLFDWITPGIRFEQELAEKHNIAVAIVVGALLLGVSIVMAAIASA